ncbi:MAG TPA: hypothetical protein VFW00_13115 [Rhodocyclaceae bacterium]|nr:hypothetical protein [Rhodocyclaceae bacterium]
MSMGYLAALLALTSWRHGSAGVQSSFSPTRISTGASGLYVP